MILFSINHWRARTSEEIIGIYFPLQTQHDFVFDQPLKKQELRSKFLAFTSPFRFNMILFSINHWRARAFGANSWYLLPVSDSTWFCLRSTIEEQEPRRKFLVFTSPFWFNRILFLMNHWITWFWLKTDWVIPNSPQCTSKVQSCQDYWKLYYGDFWSRTCLHCGCEIKGEITDFVPNQVGGKNQGQKIILLRDSLICTLARILESGLK